MDTVSHGGNLFGSATKSKATVENGAAPTSAAAATGASSPESTSSSPAGVECRPSPRAVEECDSPICTGKERVTDPVTGEVKGERKIMKACGTNQCEACRERRRRQLVAHYTEQFWSAKRLRFVTLTLDKRQLRRGGVTTEQEVKAYLKRIWGLLLDRLRSRCGSVRYYRVLDRDDSNGWHIHAVLSANVPEQVLRWQWYEVGGGCVMDCRRLDTPSQVAKQEDREQAEETLARAFGYLVHKAQNVDGAQLQPSEGDGYRSPSAVEKRKRRAQQNASSSDGRDAGDGRGGSDGPESGEPESPGGASSGDGGALDSNRQTQSSDDKTTRIKVTDESLSSPEEVLEAVKRELRMAVGEWIRLEDGTVARLLKVADTLTVVEEGADRTRTDVAPFDVDAQVPDIHEFIPMSSPTGRQAGATAGGSGGGSEQVLSDERFERVRQAMRTSQYIGTNEDGERVRWTYDRENQTVTSEVLDE